MLHPRRGYPVLGGPLEPVAGDVRLRATLTEVSAPPDERLVRFTLSPGGSGGPRALVVELMGNQWNALVVEGDGSDAVIRHVLWRREGPREQTVGHAYGPPAPTRRQGVGGEVTRDEWARALDALEPEKQRAALIRTFAWTSTINADALLGASASNAEARLDAGYTLWKLLADGSAPCEPVVLELG